MMRKQSIQKFSKQQLPVSDPFIKAGSQVLASYYQHLLKCGNQITAKTSVDNIHQMRIISRKMRILFKHCKDYYPYENCKAVRKSLKKLANKLGQIRDLDTFLEYLHSYETMIPKEYHPQLIQFRKDLKKIRAEKENDFLEFLSKKSYQKLQNEMNSLILSSHKSKNIKSIQDELPTLFNSLLDTILSHKDLENVPSQVLHKLRIQFKYLRYMCEFFKNYYGTELQKIIEELVAAQEILGVIQDKDRDISFLQDKLIEIWDVPSHPDLDRLVKNLIKSMEKIKTIKRKEFFRFWRRFNSAEYIAKIRSAFNRLN